jgi:hypothetical protein
MTTPHSIPPRGEPSRATLRFIFVLGFASIAFTVVFCYISALTLGRPPAEIFQKTLGLMAAHTAGGRLFNAGAGIEMHLPDWFIIYQCWIYDFVLMCFGYPLFAWGYKKASHLPLVGPHLDSAHQAALTHSHTVRPYGLAGLMIFVITPIWATGPLVGTILGYILGLGAAPTFLAVGSANMISTVFYVYAYAWLADKNQRLALGLLAAILGIAILGFLFRMARKLWISESPAAALLPVGVAAKIDKE